MLNYDDKFLRAAKLPAHVRPVWFSMADESADVCALSIQQEKDGMSFVLEDQEEGTFVVKIPAMGKHNVPMRWRPTAPPPVWAVIPAR